MKAIINHFFDINCREDAYTAVGRIIEVSQKLEEEYRELALLLNIELKNIDSKSLNIMNNKLMNENKISNENYTILDRVIHVRNYINHEFFLNDFNEPLPYLDKNLNKAMLCICEGIDVVDNLIDEQHGSSCKRPTIFD